MMPRLLAVCLLFTITLPAVAEEAQPKPVVTPVSSNARWFRLVVGGEKPRTIVGFVDESRGTGKGYNRFVIDWDGNGTPEAIFAFPPARDWETGKFVPSPTLKLRMGETRLGLELYGLAFPEEGEGGERRVWMNWTVREGAFSARFINGQGRLYPSADAAERGTPIHLGPPFRFDVNSTTRGPEALISVGLKDANDATLRVAGNETERKISVRLTAGENVKLDTTAEYG